jgi:hypothetical protein
MKLLPIPLIMVFLTFFSCAPTRFVKPLDKGQTAVTGNIGGPLVGFAGTTIPIPFTSLGAGYGISNTTTVFGNLHTTALAFGVVQVDAGVLHSLVAQNGYWPGITGSLSANIMTDIHEANTKLFPQLDANAYWNYGPKSNFFYLGTSNWVDLAGTRAHEEPQPNNWIFNLQAGHTFVRPKWNFVLEAKYLAPFHSRQNLVVDYTGFGNRGAVGTYFGVVRKF